MIYASSKDALHRRLEGIHIDLQATDFSEITKEASESKPTGRSAVYPSPLSLVENGLAVHGKGLANTHSP